VSYQAVFIPNTDTEPAVLHAINQAQSQITMAVFSFTSSAVADALVAAKNRGVLVRVAIDKAQSASPGQQVDKLTSNGIEVRKVRATDLGGSMRHNFAIFDRQRVMLSSFEWAVNPDPSHWSDVLFISAPEVIEFYELQYLRLAQAS
jgi:type IV secretion system protein VirD4